MQKQRPLPFKFSNLGSILLLHIHPLTDKKFRSARRLATYASLEEEYLTTKAPTMDNLPCIRNVDQI